MKQIRHQQLEENIAPGSLCMMTGPQIQRNGAEYSTYIPVKEQLHNGKN